MGGLKKARSHGLSWFEVERSAATLMLKQPQQQDTHKAIQVLHH